jgi:hypothetical protein
MRLTDQEIAHIIGEIETKENLDRKAREYASYQIYQGSLRYYVQERLKALFPKTWDAYTVMDYSILKKIVDKKAKSYKETPKRKLGTDTETQAYELLMRRGMFNRAMKKVDRLYNQHKYCLLGVFRDKETVSGKSTEKWRFMALAPFEFDVILSDNGDLEVVILSYPDQMVTSGQKTDGIDTRIAGAVQDVGVKTKRYTLWTDEGHYYVEAKKPISSEKWQITQIPIETNAENVNPYGMMNFVYLPFDDSQDYPVQSPLAYQTVELNANLSVYETSGNFQIGSLVVEHPTGQAVDSVRVGLFNAIRLPQSTNADDKPTKAYYISPSPDLAGHKDAVMTHATLILDEQGIRGNKNILGDESFASGLDRIVANADVNDIIEENQEDYMLVEQSVYQIVRSIYAQDRVNMFKTETLSVTYRKPKVMITDSERLENISKKKELGIFHDYELLQDYDPNLSTEEAKAKLLELRAGRVQSANRMASELNPPEVVNADNEE